MKRKIIIAFCILSSATQISPQTPAQLGQRAHDAMQKLQIEPFNALMRQAASQYKNKPKEFLEFINARAQDDWTMLMTAVALEDQARLRIILETTIQALANHKNNIGQVLNAQNKYGETAFYIACDFNNIHALRTILGYAAVIFKDEKKLFAQFINTPESADAWTGLMVLAYISADTALHDAVQAARDILGADSEEYDKFINAENIYYENAFSLAIDEWNKFFLKQHGAREPSRKIDEIRKLQHEMGKQLLHIIKHTKAKRALQELLDTFAHQFPNDNNGYFHFITTRDEAGWTAFVNAAAEGNIEFMDIIYNAAKKYYDGKPDWLLYILLTSDIHTRTPLLLAVTRQHYDVAERLLQLHKDLIGNDKRLYAQFINFHSSLSGFTPIIKAGYISEDTDESRNLLLLLLKRSKDVFGLENAWFNSFINRTDYNNYTALTYVIIPSLRKLLMQYGAKDPLKPAATYAIRNGKLY